MHAHQRSSEPVATIGLDIGKNTFHLVGLDSAAPSPCASRYRATSWCAASSICLLAFSV
jgi:hypothetical protein